MVLHEQEVNTALNKKPQKPIFVEKKLPKNQSTNAKIAESMDSIMLGQVKNALDQLEKQIDLEQQDGIIQKQVDNAMDKLQEHEEEDRLEEKIKRIKGVADTICDENPENYLFFTQYGGQLTTKQLLADKKTDIDLRLVCLEIPTRIQQEEIKKKLVDAAKGIPVEIYFSKAEDYINGIVGETGTFTSLEVVSEGLNPEVINTKIKHPEIFALYTFGTTRFFSNKSDEEIANHISQATGEYTYDDLIPENIIKKIKPNNESAIDWLHEYLGKFVAEHKEIISLSIKGDQTTEVLRGYLKRLSKYVIRIAFGVSIIDEDLEKFKPDYIQQLQIPGLHADGAHLNLIAETSKSWLNQIVSNLLKESLDLRMNNQNVSDENNYEKTTLKSLEEQCERLENKQQKSQLSKKELEKLELIQQQVKEITFLKEQQKRIENVLLFIAQQAGGLSRKKEFNSIYDFLNIIAVDNVLDTTEEETTGVEKVTFKEGEHFITQGDVSEEMYVLPREKSNGDPNGGINIIIHNTLTLLGRVKPILGELGIFSGKPRSVGVAANADLEAIVIPKKFLEELFSAKTPDGSRLLFKGFLLSTVDTDDFELFNKVLLIFSLLNYFSNEFVQYLYEQIEYGCKFSNQEQPLNMLSEYKVDNFVDIITNLGQMEKIEATELTYIDSTVLFSDRDTNDDFFYIIAEGGVTLSFDEGKSGTNDLVLGVGDIVGESSLILGDKVRNHTATTLPSTTKLIKVASTHFKRVTNNTNIMHVPINNNSEFIEVTGMELMTHLSLLCLDRLQKVKKD